MREDKIITAKWEKEGVLIFPLWGVGEATLKQTADNLRD